MTRQLVLITLLALIGGAACGEGGLVDARGNTWVRYIDDAGGVLVSEDGRFTFRFPAGALREGYALEIRELTPASDRFAGVLYQVARIDGGSGEIELQKPATITLRYLDTAEYLEPPQLGRVAQGEAWKPVKFVLEGNKLVAREVMRTGTFAAWDACRNDGGCGGGRICADGMCVAPECTKDPDCGAPSKACSAGRCVTTCEDTCTGNGDCAAREICAIAGGCRACVPDPACTGSEICDDGVDNDCDGQKDAADDECATSGCTGDRQCPSDEAPYCVDGLCVACRENLDCDPFAEEVCSSRYACEIVTCGSDVDCPQYSGCYPSRNQTSSICYACPGPGTESYCVTDLECGRGYICEGWGNGCRFCTTAQCYITADCPEGHSCAGGRCVDATCTDKDGDSYSPEAGCGQVQDCDDTDFYVHPGRPERCNGRDDDCNGSTDDGNDTVLCPFGGRCVDGSCS